MEIIAQRDMETELRNGAPGVFRYFLNFIMATETKNKHGNIETEKDALLCISSNQVLSRKRKCDEHIRNDDNCAIYHKIDILLRKLRPNANGGTTWGSYKDSENRIKFLRHVSQGETNTSLRIDTEILAWIEESSCNTAYP